ncbi:DMT family transporter [Gluconobacter roseus]|uniref:EamA domain-containing protein n=1 Tax=Gluconobacter roseus NBRC 3990 TaxID=1307950 RepID=A0A4Y3M803_9PROT|nr:DMT family transporter [Gluconobacter roseus]KXV42606.1 hypothetical protein AD943_10930 [Gluconobacter roseus]GBR49674.1 hypothetical protein AA3990_2604 [Gluconobacter roseus NBRC 3990]GEB04026.1 hypothetical protein GRO01_16020 [Gluconobacter roseus NBRC 3990]GLP92471.1 hypothetical protein GCM10007871_04490 [Gluconobacter roseus NBRC 3990]
MKILIWLLPVFAGLSNPLQSAANTGLNKALGPGLTILTVYAVALSGLACLFAFLPTDSTTAAQPLMTRLQHVPWWAWTGGLCNLMFVVAGSIATRQTGSAAFTVITLTCAVCLSLILDHYGLLGLKQHALSLPRLLGAAMAIGGVLLVSFT